MLDKSDVDGKGDGGCVDKDDGCDKNDKDGES